MFESLTDRLREWISGPKDPREDARARLDAEREALRRQVVRFNEGLASQAATVERLDREIASLRSQEGDLDVRVRALLEAGDRPRAGEVAMALKDLRGRIATLQSRREQAEKAYHEMTAERDRAAKAAREKMDTVRQSLSEAEMMEAQAELRDVASSTPTLEGGTGQSVERLAEDIQDRRDFAAGRVRVSGDAAASQGPPPLSDVERAALAEKALREFESGQ